MSKVKIKQLFLGNSNAYLLACNNDLALIDGGLGQQSSKILRAAEDLVPSAALKYIFVTHAHYDHVGCISRLQKEFSVPVIAQKLAAQNLLKGESPVPAGTIWFAKQVSWLGCLLFNSCIKFKPVSCDYTFSQSISLPFGGKTIRCFHTPGHTKGSACVEFEAELFCGDTFFHLLPGKIYPPFADNQTELMQSWKNISRMKIRRIYPGHGKSFSINLLRHYLNKSKANQ
ncbi:MAG: MBL fold metallo-hydrolase [Candidatus Rifleibacteriota bacterium]